VKILFDQGTPVPLRRELVGHAVATAYEQGWSTLRNGELIAEAEAAGFDVFITTDRNLKYQQNLQARRLHMVVLMTTSWPRIRAALPRVLEAIAQSQASGYVEVLFE
jgi:hypothetical protein